MTSSRNTPLPGNSTIINSDLGFQLNLPPRTQSSSPYPAFVGVISKKKGTAQVAFLFAMVVASLLEVFLAIVNTSFTLKLLGFTTISRSTAQAPPPLQDLSAQQHELPSAPPPEFPGFPVTIGMPTAPPQAYPTEPPPPYYLVVSGDTILP
ncbi:hypothetical protein NDU88_000477 [Pleurodeles waltl]|uniref:Uncharacterized protein n=1 Tax=Pleurodeles waltl TaxID=8319 RepID=A0AAV7SXF0_PLEWA|nr:hypothetical protein NDU88_000477 [Pleurodeles waltl]